MRVRDMTRGSATRMILSTALPLMLGNMFQQLYTIVDVSVVGQGIGLQALAALGCGKTDAAMQHCSDLYRRGFMPYFRDDFDTGKLFIRSLFEQNHHSAFDLGLADIALRQRRLSGGFWLTTRWEVMRI